MILEGASHSTVQDKLPTQDRTLALNGLGTQKIYESRAVMRRQFPQSEDAGMSQAVRQSDRDKHRSILAGTGGACQNG